MYICTAARFLALIGKYPNKLRDFLNLELSWDGKTNQLIYRHNINISSLLAFLAGLATSIIYTYSACLAVGEWIGCNDILISIAVKVCKHEIYAD
jgi:hypothetical protein